MAHHFTMLSYDLKLYDQTTSSCSNAALRLGTIADGPIHTRIESISDQSPTTYIIPDMTYGLLREAV